MADDDDYGITDLAKYAETLVKFAKDPTGFIRNNVLTIVVGAILSLVFNVVEMFNTIVDVVLGDVFGSAGEALLGSVAVIGSIPFLLLDAINELLVTLASAGGIFSPIVYVVAWVVLLVLAIEALRLTWRAIVVIT